MNTLKDMSLVKGVGRVANIVTVNLKNNGGPHETCTRKFQENIQSFE